eukprot:CCRYP_003503-RA/>CCRYP_003503-RA protein AED:0.46 eAED:0.46 QI:136/1/1/1/0/0/2/98/56
MVMTRARERGRLCAVLSNATECYGNLYLFLSKNKFQYDFFGASSLIRNITEKIFIT